MSERDRSSGHPERRAGRERPRPATGSRRRSSRSRRWRPRDSEPGDRPPPVPVASDRGIASLSDLPQARDRRPVRVACCARRGNFSHLTDATPSTSLLASPRPTGAGRTRRHCGEGLGMDTMDPMDEDSTPDTILLIHGLWMTPRSWEHWKERYEGRGYTVLAPAWPGMEVEVEALNADPDQIASSTSSRSSITTTRSSATSTARRSSWGTRSAGRSRRSCSTGAGAAGVGVSSATVKGILDLPWSTIKSSAPALLKSKGKAVGLTPKEFHYAFTTPSRKRNPARSTSATPCRARRLSCTKALRKLPPQPTDEGRLRCEARAPMLLIGFGEDHVIPAKVSPPPGGEVRRRGDDHRVQALRRSSALPRSAGLGRGGRLRAPLGDGAREPGRVRARGRGGVGGERPPTRTYPRHDEGGAEGGDLADLGRGVHLTPSSGGGGGVAVFPRGCLGWR